MKKLFTGLSLAAGAKTITVDCAGGADFRTIGAAMKAVGKGDVVLVRPGVYREEVRIPVGGLSRERPTVLRSAVRREGGVRAGPCPARPRIRPRAPEMRPQAAFFAILSRKLGGRTGRMGL